ncbi:hypothetical protein Q4512_11785 [Oceanihabitans sp. 2_MG-2023]|uniref:hypothetical protein n=1 Tax=Oceanihabitans sp. 2_MG-2023 TaxID=3062661 RepID=UPI0026E47FAF|nr:hypothetical protein [Oceanihabitans sp. 2_MG-2023]MDO6597597.1 hypothetical protein [Oceanihabitans sp. 2_MG-2023]
MRNDYKSEGFKKLLDRLQQESWQLELLISGFAIFGLFSLQAYIFDEYAQNVQDVNIYKIALLASATPIIFILLFNLIIHVLLRGLWIGALGLRYVSGDIEYEKLNYSVKFTAYLKRKVGSFDKYISKLEDYCSIMFAVSFLMVFYVLGIISVIFIFSITKNYFNLYEGPLASVLNIIGNILGFFFAIGMLLTLIDFVSQGFLKKKKALANIYFPFYKIFSLLTLSFLYRPLVYNFLDNKFGRRISLLLFPLYFLIFLSTATYYKTSNYIKTTRLSTSQYASNNNYYDVLPEKEFINTAAITSKIITKSHLPLFIPYVESIEDRIFEFNPTLAPLKDTRGLSSNITFTSKNSKTNRDSLVTLYLKTFKSIYKVSIDSTKYNLDYIISENKKKQIGFETIIDIDSLQNGRHTLHLKRIMKPKTDSIGNIISIPFWYYHE